MRRLFLVCIALAGLLAKAVAAPCDPVESAPGVKSLPEGCKPRTSVGMKPDKLETSDKRAAGRGHSWKVGDAEVHLGGKVIFEAGAGTRR